MKYRIKETGVIVEKPLGLHCYYIGQDSYKPDDLKALGLTLEPYVEPVKKLYAYKNITTEEVIFKTDDDSITVHPIMRWTAYDITYPKEQ